MVLFGPAHPIIPPMFPTAPLLGQPPVLPHPAYGHKATGREPPAPRGQPGGVVGAIRQALRQPGLPGEMGGSKISTDPHVKGLLR